MWKSRQTVVSEEGFHAARLAAAAALARGENPFNAWVEAWLTVVTEPRRTLVQLCEAIGADAKSLACYRRPFNHPEFRIPRPDAMRRIWIFTGEVIDANAFYGLIEERAAA